MALVYRELEVAVSYYPNSWVAGSQPPPKMQFKIKAHIEVGTRNRRIDVIAIEPQMREYDGVMEMRRAVSDEIRHTLNLPRAQVRWRTRSEP